MQYSHKPWEELEQARAALQAIKNTREGFDYERHWQDYLSHIERVWGKAKNHFEKSPKWKNWAEPYWQTKKTDPLLAYLRTARGQYEHTVDSVVSKDMPALRNFKPGGPANAVDMVKVKGDDGQTYYEMRPFRMNMIGVETTLPPVTFDKKTHQPPSVHLGAAIDPKDIPALAEMGIKWYEDFLKAADAEFVTHNKP